MKNNSSRKIVLRGQGKIFLLRFLLVVILSIPALTASLFFVDKFELVDNLDQFLNLFLSTIGFLFILAGVLSLSFSRKKRTIEITKDYVKFPWGRFHKYFFKREEIEGMNVIIPWLWRIGKYFGEGGLLIRVFYKENGILKSAGQAVYEDFNPEEVVRSLRELGYKVNEYRLGGNYFTLKK